MAPTRCVAMRPGRRLAIRLVTRALRLGSIVVALTVLACAANARAYVIGGTAWPDHVVTYHNDSAVDARAVAEAVHDWNTSGVHVRFVASSAGRAEVTIVTMPPHFFPTIKLPGIGSVSPDALGFATVGRAPRDGPEPSPSGRYQYRGSHVWLRSIGSYVNEDGQRIKQTEPTMARVTVHELGHVLGLGHELHVCATMNPDLGSQCHPPHPWMGLCPDPLQPDDIRGAVALYGGTAPPPGTRLCSLSRAPGAPRAVTAELKTSSSGNVAVTWIDPPGVTIHGRTFDPYSFGGRPSVVNVELDGQRGTCPTPGSNTLFAARAKPSATTTTSLSLTPGSWCLTVRVQDGFGRWGPTAKTTVTVTTVKPPPSPPPPAQGPVADLSVPAQLIAGQPAAFQDGSEPGSAPINSWQWSFGDGTTSTAENPTHVYAQAGSYTVKLTVADTNGKSDTDTQQVTVQAPQPPTADFFSDPEVVAGQDVAFTDDSSPGTTAIASWNWSFGDGATSTAENPDHRYSQTGMYTVTLTVTDDDGLYSTSSATIVVDAPGEGP
jgi:PKD repeat protein